VPSHVVYSTSMGCGFLLFNGHRLARHLLPGDPRARIVIETVELWPKNHGIVRGKASHFGRELALQMSGYFEHGEEIRAELEFDFDETTEFAVKVYNQAMTISFGHVSTYGRIAAAIGCGSPRAVGRALAANQLPLFVPCHRIIASDGLGGWSGPPGLKAKMLALENLL